MYHEVLKYKLGLVLASIKNEQRVEIRLNLIKQGIDIIYSHMEDNKIPLMQLSSVFNIKLNEFGLELSKTWIQLTPLEKLNKQAYFEYIDDLISFKGMREICKERNEKHSVFYNFFRCAQTSDVLPQSREKESSRSITSSINSKN